MIRRRSSLLVLTLTLGVALALKLGFRSASADDLAWILRPTSWLVGRLSGVQFELEAGVGYLSRETRFVILPVCAGVNFMVVAFVSAVLVHEARFPLLREKLGCVGVSLPGAYALTVTTNAVRIAIALHLRGLSFGWWSEARVHELVGVLVYLTSLLLASWASSSLWSPRAVSV